MAAAEIERAAAEVVSFRAARGSSPGDGGRREAGCERSEEAAQRHGRPGVGLPRRAVGGVREASGVANS